ncbi:Uncharacterised protein [Acetobacterium wieringae]|nr:Uncharacterised protein [Acetobacterium wieringae]
MKDVFERLREKLDELGAGFPKSSNGWDVGLLKNLYTDEEAELFIQMTDELETPEQVARRMGGDIEILTEMLYSMSKKGILYRVHDGSEIKYSTIPFVVGIWEFQKNNTNQEFFMNTFPYLMSDFGPALFKEDLPVLRYIPIKSELNTNLEIMKYDDATDIIKSSQRVSLAECMCRKLQRLAGNDCGHSLETCIQFDEWADYYVENGLAQYISNEEALEKLKIAEDENLVLEVANSQKPVLMCMCCSCCCGPMSILKTFPGKANNLLSNFFCKYDPEKCIKCDKCIEVCPMDARSRNEDVLSINLEKCVGCGICVKNCSGKASQLKEKQNQYIPAETMFDSFKQIEDKRKQ